MARGQAWTQEEIDKVLQHYLATGKANKAKSCALIGIAANGTSQFFKSSRVQQRLTQLEIEADKQIEERSVGVPEPLTKKEFQNLLLSKIKDPSIKEEIVARYIEMYGKTNGSFSEKIEIEGSISLAEILTNRRKKSKHIE